MGEKDRETSAGKSGAMKEIRDREVVLAADTAYDAQGWVQALENQIAVAASTLHWNRKGAWEQISVLQNERQRSKFCFEWRWGPFDTCTAQYKSENCKRLDSESRVDFG